jgi:hypothetical protein
MQNKLSKDEIEAIYFKDKSGLDFILNNYSERLSEGAFSGINKAISNAITKLVILNIPSVITITDNFKPTSVKYSNYNINIKQLLRDSVNGILKIVPSTAIAKYCSGLFVGSTLSNPVAIAIGTILVIYTTSEIVKNKKIDLSRDHGLLLYAMWNNRDMETDWVPKNTVYKIYNRFLTKNKFQPKAENDIWLLLDDLKRIKSIEIDNYNIFLKEKIEISFNEDYFKK